MVELVGEGSVINRAYPVKFVAAYLSKLWSSYFDHHVPCMMLLWMIKEHCNIFGLVVFNGSLSWPFEGKYVRKPVSRSMS